MVEGGRVSWLSFQGRYKSDVHAFPLLTDDLGHPPFDCASSPVLYVAMSVFHQLFSRLFAPTAED